MNKRIVLVLLSFIIVASVLFAGCTDENKTETTDNPIITQGVIKIGLLLNSEETYKNTSQLIKDGFDYAHSLASSVNIGDKVEVETVYADYSSAAEASEASEELYNQGVSAVVTDSVRLDVFTEVSTFFLDKNIPVISLSKYLDYYDTTYTLAVDRLYSASVASTYAKDKGYQTAAAILGNDSEYHTKFFNRLSDSLVSYINSKPTAYYYEGDSTNYTPDVIVGGNYDFIYLLCDLDVCEKIVSDLRQSGFSGDIILGEILDKTFVEKDVFNGCSYISKLELDNANNISSVFYNNYSEYKDISKSAVSAASAYGYDAYMTVFEGLKTFGDNSVSSIFKSTEPTETTDSASKEILASDLNEAIFSIKYYGVTDIVRFSYNVSRPTYIYINNINDSKTVLAGKYTFVQTDTQGSLNAEGE